MHGALQKLCTKLYLKPIWSSKALLTRSTNTKKSYNRLYGRPYGRLYERPCIVSTNGPTNSSASSLLTALQRLCIVSTNGPTNGPTNGSTNSSTNNSTNGSTIAYTMPIQSSVQTALQRLRGSRARSSVQKLSRAYITTRTQPPR